MPTVSLHTPHDSAPALSQLQDLVGQASWPQVRRLRTESCSSAAKVTQVARSGVRGTPLFNLEVTHGDSQSLHGPLLLLL